jgi:glutamyl-Q tRNA(Asp) synthetase
VLRLLDGLFAYQLSGVGDVAEQVVTDIVRGADLLDNTPRQILLQQRLGLPTPTHAHLPLATHADGQKLSKQSFAREIPVPALPRLLWRALDFLGQRPPQELENALPEEILAWGVRHWRITHVPPRTAAVPAGIT